MFLNQAIPLVLEDTIDVGSRLVGWLSPPAISFRPSEWNRTVRSRYDALAFRYTYQRHNVLEKASTTIYVLVTRKCVLARLMFR